MVLNLSSRYFKLSQLWLERAALLLLVFLGCYWIWQGLRTYRKKAKLAIKSLNPLLQHPKSAVKNNRTFCKRGKTFGIVESMLNFARKNVTNVAFFEFG